MRSHVVRLLRLLLPLSLVTLLGCQVSIQSLGYGSGTVVINPGAITCTISTGVADGPCLQDLPDDAVITLTATAGAGSVFTQWSGDCDTIAVNVCTTKADRLKFVFVGFEPAAAPAAPTDLVATPVSTSQIDLSWTDNANNEAGYFVERCQGSGCTGFSPLPQLAANVTSYSDTGLAAATTYRYRVRSGNPLGFSSYVTSGDVTTLSPP